MVEIIMRIVIGIVLSVLVTAFVQMGFNPVEWTHLGRVLFLVFLAGCIAIMFIDKGLV